MATVDLREADCKEELEIRINGECLRDNNASDEQWFETYSDVLNEIGNQLHNDDWAQSFELYTKNDNTSVDDLNKFINVIKKQYSTETKTLFSFCVKASLECFHVTLFFCLFPLFIFFFFFFYCFMVLSLTENKTKK